MKWLLSLVILTATLTVSRDSSADAAASGPALDANGDKKVDGVEVQALLDAPASAPAVVGDVKEVAKAVSKFKESETKSAVVWMALLSTIFKLLLSIMKYVPKLSTWFSTATGKLVTRYSTLALGLLAGVTANFGFGMSWIDSIVIAVSGPLAVAIHEYTSPTPEASS